MSASACKHVRTVSAYSFDCCQWTRDRFDIRRFRHQSVCTMFMGSHELFTLLFIFWFAIGLSITIATADCSSVYGRSLLMLTCISYRSMMFFSCSVLNQVTLSFNNQTSLHLACSTLSLDTARILLDTGADRTILDDQQRTPTGRHSIVLSTFALIEHDTIDSIDCIPTLKIDAQQRRKADELRNYFHRSSTSQQPSAMIDSIIHSKKMIFSRYSTWNMF
jgi:hypothetical protein